MKSIFFLSVMNGSAWGGSEEQWFRIALWMAKEKKYDVAVSCFDWIEKKEKLDLLQKAGVKLFLLPSKNKGLLAKWKLRQQVNNIPFESFDLVFINQGGFEDISHNPFKTVYKRCNKYVTSSHNYNENSTLSSSKRNLLQQWFSNAALNIGDSQKIFDTLEKSYGIPVPKQKVIYNPIGFPVDTKELTNTLSKRDFVIFIMLAAFDVHRKAQDLLIKTLSLNKWKNRNWQLHLYGKGKDQPMLERIVKENKLEQKVCFKGHTKNVAAALHESDLCLQITHMDAMPISVTEAMAMAKPCVVSKAGDMPVWVKHEENGFICEAVTIEAIDDVLENAWQQKSKWIEMGKKAFATFRQLYPQPYEEKIVSVLKSL